MCRRGSFDPNRLDGRDTALIRRALPLVRAFNRRYVRLCVDGAAHLLATPTLYVANHNGGIAGPDLLCTMGTLWDALGPDAPLHALAHDFAMRQFTPLGRLLQRAGAVSARQENVDRVLAAGGSVLVYPGGDLDAYRHSRRRDEIVLGGRSGFVRAAQRTGAPIVPIVAHGAHRSAYVFHEGEELARRLRLKAWGRLERFPVAFALPWGIALGPWVPYLPLPFSIRLKILPPIEADASRKPDDLREEVRHEMQSALDAMAREARNGG